MTSVVQQQFYEGLRIIFVRKKKKKTFIPQLFSFASPWHHFGEYHDTCACFDLYLRYRLPCCTSVIIQNRCIPYKPQGRRMDISYQYFKPCLFLNYCLIIRNNTSIFNHHRDHYMRLKLSINTYDFVTCITVP